MLNKYPMWKYLLVLAVLAIGILYATPNLYGRDPAIQVSGTKGASADLSVLDKVNETLKLQNVMMQFQKDIQSIVQQQVQQVLCCISFL